MRADARLISIDARPFGGPSRGCPAVLASTSREETQRARGPVLICDLAQFPLFLSYRLQKSKGKEIFVHLARDIDAFGRSIRFASFQAFVVNRRALLAQ